MFASQKQVSGLSNWALVFTDSKGCNHIRIADFQLSVYLYNIKYNIMGGAAYDCLGFLCIVVGLYLTINSASRQLLLWFSTILKNWTVQLFIYRTNVIIFPYICKQYNIILMRINSLSLGLSKQSLSTELWWHPHPQSWAMVGQQAVTHFCAPSRAFVCRTPTPSLTPSPSLLHTHILQYLWRT